MNYKFVSHPQENSESKVISIMESNGNGFVRCYIPKNETESIYFDMLSVSELSRRKGLGECLVDEVNKIGIANGCVKSILFADINSWVVDWYSRIGYDKYSLLDDKNTWMIKVLYL